MQQTKKLKVAFFFFVCFAFFFIFNVIQHFETNWLSLQGITSFKIQKQVPLNLDEKSSQYDTVTIDVMNKW